MENESVNYHALSSVSRSMLVDFMASRRLYHGRYVTKTVPLVEETNAMRIGTCSHLLALQPELFEKNVVEIPAGVLASNGARTGNAWKEFAAQCQADGITPVSAGELASIRGMSAAIRERVGKLISGPTVRFEDVIEWCDLSSGLECRAMLDIAIELPQHVVILDVKTTTDAGDKWRWKIRDLGYWCQYPHYSEAVRHKYGDRPTHFVFVVVESKPPYLCRQYAMSERMREKSTLKWRAGLNDLAWCHENDIWIDDAEQTIQEVDMDL